MGFRVYFRNMLLSEDYGYFYLLIWNLHIRDLRIIPKIISQSYVRDVTANFGHHSFCIYDTIRYCDLLYDMYLF